MKTNEVPQDKAYFEEGKIRDVCYAVDDKGNYTKVLSLGWEPKNEAIKLSWELIYTRVENIRKEVINGHLSPIAFYMELNVMDVSILADYTGIPKRKVKKHLKMKRFLELRTEVLQQYAKTFNITVEELKDIEKIKSFKFNNED
jgi:hypothetical protein